MDFCRSRVKEVGQARPNVKEARCSLIMKSYCPLAGAAHALARVSCGSSELQLLGYIMHTMLDAWASLPEVGA
jgi:hypothetical protein